MSMSLISLESWHELRLSGLLHRLGTVRAVAVRHQARISSASLLPPSTLPWFAWSPHLLCPALSASSSNPRLAYCQRRASLLSVDCPQEHMLLHRPCFLPSHPPACQPAQDGRVGASPRKGRKTRTRSRTRQWPPPWRPAGPRWMAGAWVVGIANRADQADTGLLHDAAFVGLLRTATVDPDYTVPGYLPGRMAPIFTLIGG